MAGLPESVRAAVRLSPGEDIALALLRAALPEVQVQSLIRARQTFPLVLVRRGASLGNWEGDPRGFVDSVQLVVHTFAEDPDGDTDASILAEAVRVTLTDAWLRGTVVPGLGHVTGVECTDAPRRVTDWATATGPVQYADLPTGMHRYESAYTIEVRPAR